MMCFDARTTTLEQFWDFAAWLVMLAMAFGLGVYAGTAIRGVDRS